MKLPFQRRHVRARVRGAAIWVCCCAALVALTGCATSGTAVGSRGDTAGYLHPFTPTRTMAGLQLESGAYPNLFTGRSNAAWLHPGMPMPDPETEEALSLFGPDFAVFRVELESLFPDMSIAYDAVGLRGLHIYLRTPDGQELSPVQTIVGKELQEEREGALRRFRRVNYLLFPRDAIQVMVPWSGGALADARLVLEGFETVFSFSWQAQPPSSQPIPPPGAWPGVPAGKAQLKRGTEKTKAFLHHFD